MADTWVANASPIIVLAKTGHLRLLEEPGVDILVPEAVAKEILAGPIGDPARLALEGGWGTSVPVDEIPDEILEWSLGAGESSVIAAALKRPGSVALLDDAEGRACARSLGVPMMGTLGIVLRSRRLERIESAARVIRDLRTAGLHLDEEVVRRVVEQD